MKTWYEDEAFWETWAPFMFSKERWENAAEEVANLISLLKIDPGASVLDLCCGPGRHSLELARRGFSVVGVDRTETYLEKARKQAETEGLDVEFIREDMRSYCKPDSFDAAINLFTSFGFFEDKKEDETVIQNVNRSLKGGGIFLIDTMGKEILARIFRERDWQEINGAIMLEERKVTKDWSWMENRWILLKGGKTQEFRFSLRPYSAAELTKLLTECGFAETEVYGNLAGAPYDHKAKRLVVVAQKRKEKV
ncbi:MAG: methyltransferase domain-containing protein [candidate division Zixibacteria bacterium]|nr:methyltransferase domain-containing protein [candidate division Zixibacteria bacterium]